MAHERYSFPNDAGSRPEVSVVISVYNEADSLQRSIDSILVQGDVDLQFVIVNDGSTDRSEDILSQYAEQDHRVQIVSQENQGLTKSLIRGCALARGKCIARQDAGDVSLPGRLRNQLDRFNKDPDATLVSCGTRFIGPEREFLYEIIQTNREAKDGLSQQNQRHIRGPSHHGSVMFPRAAYESVGGYRGEFCVAQDLDLWLRLSEIGHHVSVPKVFYEAVVKPLDLSRCYRKEQVRLTKLILESGRLRREGQDEGPVLKRASQIALTRKSANKRLTYARGCYFIGACLKSNNDQNAQKYFRMAIKAYPLHLRSWFRLVL
jgi:glycosyltransferase involved in cell wall biosynthesis